MATTDTDTIVEEPRERELGEAWNEEGTAAPEEFGYQPQAATESPEAPTPQYDFPADDDHAGPDEAPAAEPPAETKPPALSREDWADYGLSESEARGLDAKGELANVLELLDRRFVAAGREQPAEAPAPRAPVSGPIKLSLPDVYDEDLTGPFNQLVDHVNTLHERLEEVTGGARRARMDAFFAALGPDYEPVFGAGPLDDLPGKSVLRQRRLEVETTVDALRAGYEKLGQPIPAEKALLERAARMVAGDESQQIARKKAAQQTRDMRGQFVAKPTHREGRPLSPAERAARFAEEFYKRKGM